MRMLVSATVRQPPCRTCASVRRYGLHSSAKSGVCSSQVATQFHNSWVYRTAIFWPGYHVHPHPVTTEKSIKSLDALDLLTNDDCGIRSLRSMSGLAGAPD